MMTALANDVSRSVLPRPIKEVRADALRMMEPSALQYLETGAADEITLNENETDLCSLRLLPKVLRDVSSVDTSVQLLGERLSHPVLLAPTGSHRLFHPDGECATARGASDAEALYVVSNFSTSDFGEIADSISGPWWFQLYVHPNEEVTDALIARAISAGASAIVITADTPVVGPRDRQNWDGVTLPAPLRFKMFAGLSVSFSGHDPRSIQRPWLNSAFTWESLRELCGRLSLPVILKGVLDPDDARRAVAAGVAAIIVSNHGGRNLDTTPSTIAALPGIVHAVGSDFPVLMDGGVRRGSDLVKAIAAGATAVLVGRPIIWGLAVNGADGVRDVILRLRYELEMTMASCGVRQISDIDSSLIWNGNGLDQGPTVSARRKELR